ncbi:MAG: DciA family protein [Pseudomonadota bacterium]
MVKRSSLDPIEEARARVRLRYSRAKPVFGGPKTIGQAALKKARGLMPQRGASLSRLRLNWTGIVGEQLARLCHPDKLSPVRGGQQLTLRVIPAAAGLVQHQGEMIRQRVSVAAGGTIVKLKLVQGPLPGTPRQAPTQRGVALSTDVREALIEAAKGINDPKLRAAIVALGEAVLTQET